MKSSKLLSALLAVCMPTLVLAGDDLCRNVSFRFTNNHDTRKEIKVVEVKYHNVVNDRRPTVDVGNVVCAYGATCNTAGIDLKDIEGNNVKDITFGYRYRERDGDWSDKTMVGAGPFDPNHKECRANRNYGPFAITGTVSVSGSQANPQSASSAVKSATK